MIEKSFRRAVSLPWAALSRAWPIAAMGVLGGLFLYGAGFADTAALHNAAHDARHLFAFPCH